MVENLKKKRKIKPIFGLSAIILGIKWVF